MKFFKFAPIALCLVLGACASPPPAGPSVSAIAAPNVSERKFARDDAACQARAHAGTAQAAAVAGQLGLQGQYDSIYTDCMVDRGYTVSETVARYAYRPGVNFYGPGPYALGPFTTYSWGMSAGF
jgi:hypothetical protein